MEYRQAELRLEQLYTEIRMQVVNAQFAMTNERALVKADLAAEQYAQQSYDDEVKKLHLGASTTALVLQQERALALAEDNLIAAKAAYANARAGLYQTLATTLQHYGINMDEAATGTVTVAPLIPGLQPAEKGNEPAATPPPVNQSPLREDESSQVLGFSVFARDRNDERQRLIVPPHCQADQRTREN